ncbi:uncharacterized protein LOC126368859 [Pectinophora gossypiella]|uniref:uncharacterized protein LOC126368859 n=1 Tax=Pectinophora gossypiella TaxID=13191 RepID=UPI00214F29EB|nr:uncharacterized protein LOC126368859 [Pectinophora gossypiella]
MKPLFCGRRPPCPISTIYNHTEFHNALTASKQASRVHVIESSRAGFMPLALPLRSRSDTGRTHTHDRAAYAYSSHVPRPTYTYTYTERAGRLWLHRLIKVTDDGFHHCTRQSAGDASADVQVVVGWCAVLRHLGFVPASLL